MAANGTLTLKSTPAINAEGCPVALAVDHQGNMLYAADDGCFVGAAALTTSRREPP